MAKIKHKELSKTTLRGLYVDIVEGSAKPGYYMFDKFQIVVRDKSLVGASGNERVKAWLRIPKNHRKTQRKKKEAYRKRLAENRCTKCGRIPLGKNTFGKISVMCAPCFKKARVSRIEGYKRRENEGVSVRG